MGWKSGQYKTIDIQKLDENESDLVTGGVDEEFFEYSETISHSKRVKGRLATWVGVQKK